jgi:hypothetical protein
MSSRQKEQADFDLERFIDMFDEALTSEDERVINALRSLMMMVVLTKKEVRHEGHDMNYGPLRQLFEDFHNLNRRTHDMDQRIRDLEHRNHPPGWTYPSPSQAGQGPVTDWNGDPILIKPLTTKSLLKP